MTAPSLRRSLTLIAVFAIGYFGRQFVHLDRAEQGVLLLHAKQSSECDVGGGCIAYSDREVKGLLQAALQAGAVKGYEIGRSSCGRRDL